MTSVRTTIEQGIIRVEYRGKVGFARATETLREVGQLASDNKISLLLFDIRDADYRDYYVEAIEHARQGPSMGIDKNFRIAFLGSKDEEMLRYIETVTVNRGYRSKAFTDESAAIAWLRKAV